MRVALVIRRFSPSGGAEQACFSLARGLISRGHQVHVFAEEIAAAPGVVPHPVPVEGSLEHVSFSENSRRMLRQETFDVVHSFTRTSRQDVLRLGGGTHVEYLAQTDRTRSALSRWWRRVRPKEKAELRLERESFAPGSFGKIVAVSKRVRDEVIRHYGVDPAKISVIYNGVDAPAFARNPGARARLRRDLGLRDDDYVLLFCGTGFKRKGLDFAIRAVDRVPNAKLLVAGKGSARPHPRVALLGLRDDVKDLHSAADALILPTLYDPFPNACLEAMAAGIPVIVSRIAGVSEIIDNDSIVVEDPMNVDELTAAVKKLEDPALRKTLGEAARRKALEFTPERNLEENLRIYAEIRGIPQMPEKEI